MGPDASGAPGRAPSGCQPQTISFVPGTEAAAGAKVARPRFFFAEVPSTFRDATKIEIRPGNGVGNTSAAPKRVELFLADATMNAGGKADFGQDSSTTRFIPEERARRSHRQGVARSPFHRPEGEAQVRAGQGYRAKDGEVTFDMFEGTFTHVGDRCTFEVLVDAFGLKDPGLRAIAEIVHDIDIKDGKFDRPEAPGFASLVAAIALTRRDDDARIAFGGEILDAVLELYRRKRTSPEET